MSSPALSHLDPALSIPERVNSLLSIMTLTEKVGQMLQLDARGELEEAVLGKQAGSLLHASPVRIHEAARLVQRTRLRIPLLMADDCIHGYSFWPGATILPTQLAMACTWDPALVERGARLTAREVATTGIHWTFSPVLCISRDPRWGRVGETFGEDPHLIGELGAAMIRGYQGGGLRDPEAILATAKHFAGYSETQGGRDASEADLSRRKLRSWFLPPFERAVREGCATVMLGYQAIDGVPVTANRWLLEEVLKREWGFQGTLVTDWDNVGRMVWEQKVCTDDVEAATVAVAAGNDLVMTTPQFFNAAQAAVRGGALFESQIDDAVRRILSLKFELGLFEDPRLPDDARQRTIIGSPEHSGTNLEIARRSIVLLRNDGTLPLDGGLSRDGERAQASTPRTVAIIGPNADDPHAQLGDWAGASGQVDWMIPHGHPREATLTTLDGFRQIAPTMWNIVYARGTDIGTLVPDPAGLTYPDGQPRPPVFQNTAADPDLLAEAIATAHGADWVVAVLGDTVALTGEGRSTATLELQGGQIELLDALVETGKPVILVLIHSKPAVLPPAARHASAIVEAFNPGMQGGRAIAEIILGLEEPSGRLPISVPQHAGQIPIFYNQIRGQHGDRYADLSQHPAFVFGEGMSYTTVEYSALRMHDTVIDPGGTITATITVQNTGSRPVRETVQAYISDTVTSVTWAGRELKHFTQVDVLPGQILEAKIEFAASECSLVTADGRRVVEEGEFELLVGSSSRTEDLLTTRFTIRR